MLVILWIVGALVAIVVLAMLLVPMFIDEQALLDMAQEQVQTQTGGELVVEGETELSFFPRFGLRLEGTSLSLPAQTEYGQIIKFEVWFRGQIIHWITCAVHPNGLKPVSTGPRRVPSVG